MPQFSLTALFTIVGAFAAEAFVFAEWGLIDWIFANLLLTMALISFFLIRTRRWRTLLVSNMIFVLILGFAIPCVPPVEVSDSRQYVCATCQSYKNVVDLRPLDSGWSRFRPRATENGSLTTTTITVEEVDSTCPHVWGLHSASMVRYSYLFGLRYPIVRETMN